MAQGRVRNGAKLTAGVQFWCYFLVVVDKLQFIGVLKTYTRPTCVFWNLPFIPEYILEILTCMTDSVEQPLPETTAWTAGLTPNSPHSG